MAIAPSNTGSGAAAKGDTPKQGAGASVVIKKYANRRLYNTETSSYITLEHLAAMTREGRDFQVFDARTGEDITRSVLTQIVMEEEATGQTMLPVPFLRQIIAMYGDSMQAMVPHYLEASMAAFAENQDKFRSAALKPFEQLAKQNLALFQAATSMLTTGLVPGATPAARPASPAPSPAAAPSDSEMAQLKSQLAALQARLDGMGKD
ncbi:polyhydroxyalkanoate synthesis repressor PhaR [Polymorphobacter fuscus]|uniref:Polyhydroxyalkanoate synthesis repressor PhaR n=1 Tax=Sandarakinorhabdus fusca TaxID=1439888 RepID=A0A7C9GPA6_9SPHN|nr:polyhydroxyalkanoate synthesis repressor PhaR [Polymorphobacter fuscus]KAB7646205.1 polyhydroxyalkanoate synthesis repressor PhaR [Polymorphobacter fuscus]MQT17412.1 polyhydroxyalkanoate synthesis repressor PhaR [Polymorphobacter fuscus]NJC10054.1 polyhydroxyalkanoate synthesis repressor PhaR [Polymorphobacter fuscus]